MRDKIRFNSMITSPRSREICCPVEINNKTECYRQEAFLSLPLSVSIPFPRQIECLVGILLIPASVRSQAYYLIFKRFTRSCPELYALPKNKTVITAKWKRKFEPYSSLRDKYNCTSRNCYRVFPVIRSERINSTIKCNCPVASSHS